MASGTESWNAACLASGLQPTTEASNDCRSGLADTLERLV